jgi:hypothetical protein
MFVVPFLPFHFDSYLHLTGSALLVAKRVTAICTYYFLISDPQVMSV